VRNPGLPDDSWIAAPVRPGSLVLIHGQVRNPGIHDDS
jgi:hypothetical protein